MLQTKMLRHPKSKLKSSACGRYQTVRTTWRKIQEALDIAGSAMFGRDMQDRVACYFLGCAASTSISPAGSARTL